MKKWPLNHARVRLNELVRKTTDDGPQTITVNGKKAAVLLSYEEYERLSKIKDKDLEKGEKA